MKVGISVRIDVTKIDKARLFKGEKGTYLDLTTFVDLANKDQYDNNGFITQTQTKEEREQGVQMPILGNVKVFYQDNNANQQQGYQNQQNPTYAQPMQQPQGAAMDDDIPFMRLDSF